MRAIFLLLFLLWCAPGSCGIILDKSVASSEGVKWAREQLIQACRTKRQTAPDITVELISKNSDSSDEYTIKPSERVNGVLLSANSEGAIIYGLLDLRDRVLLDKPIPTLIKFTPALRLRGYAETFPFWTGTTMYSSQWKVFEKIETDPNNPWFDKAHWTRRFREMAERRTNCLIFQHAHPFPALLVYDEFTEAQFYAPDVARRNAEMFRWIVAEGKKYGVSIYFLTWNIVVPPAFAKVHSIEEMGSQSQVAKDYTRYVIKKLFDTYRDLGGLITMGAETPVGCTDWVIENIVSPMNECRSKPNLIWWGWCTYPEDSLKVKRAYKGRTEILHYLQYEQYFKPMADPRIGRWSRETGGTKMIAMGGPKSAHAFYTWGDPDWARETVRSLKQDNNGSGLILETFMSSTWLAREAFARYMWNLDECGVRSAECGIVKDTDEWQKRIAQRYSPEVAEDLLACYQKASKIIPRFLCQIHSQSDHFQPQLGLPLVYYTGMHSLSSYVFEWYDGVDKRGRLVPNYGLSWPNPDWGEKVVPVNQYAYWKARGKTSFSSTTPLQISDEIETASRTCLDLLDRLDKQQPKQNADEYSQTLQFLRMNAYWGMQAAWKIRAAVAWAEFKESQTQDKADLCVSHLQQSLDWYRKLTEQASKVYLNPMHFYLSFLSSPPPWKQNDIWFSYLPVNTHWREMLPRFERELEIIKEQLALGPEKAALPLTDQLWAETETKAIAHFGSMTLDSRSLEGEWHILFKTQPDRLKLEIGKRYQVRIKYRVLNNPGKFSQPFAAAARSDTGGYTRDIGTFRSWSASTGTASEHVFQFEPKDFHDYYVFVLLRGPAAIMIDNLTISEISKG